MPRSRAALVAASLAVLVAGLATAAPGGEPSAGGAGTAIDPSSPLARLSDAERRQALGQTPYERRVLDADQDAVDLQRIVAGEDRPNVLVLMMDDMRDDDLQFMPNVQRLIADQGVRFTNMFSPQPLCCPARASFFTGLLSHNHQVWSHKPPYGFPAFDDRATFPRWLHEDGGYDTAFVGKYLNGYGRQERSDGSSSLRYVPPGWTDWRPSVDHVRDEPDAVNLQGGTYQFFDTTLSDNGVLEPHPGVYQTQLYSDITQEVIRREAGGTRPFFMQTAFAAPHDGGPRERDDPRAFVRWDGYRQAWQNPARPRYAKGRFDHRINRLAPWLNWETFADKPDFIRNEPSLVVEEYDAIVENYRQRAEAVSVVDDEVANIVAALERSGELDNTYLMLTSDNGYFLGEQRRRQGKILPYDASTRVPLVMRGPGIPAGEERRDPFTMVDFASTILEAAGVAPRAAVDGVSMLDVARTGDRGWRRPILTETGPLQLSVDIITTDDPLERPEGPSTLRFSQGVRTGRYLYVEHASRDEELYDMRRDPEQLVNLVDRPRYSGVVRLLADELDRLRTCAGADCSAPLPRRLWTRSPAPPARFDASLAPPSFDFDVP